MEISNFLQRNQKNFKPLFTPDLSNENTFFLDLSVNNARLKDIELTDTACMQEYVFGNMMKQNRQYAYGGYLEDREVYRRSALFAGGEQAARSIHLGIDVWAEAGQPVYLPYEGFIHSFQNNSQYGDYGPTIIVEHTLEGHTFYTLYGHLSLESLSGLYAGMPVEASSEICRIGQAPINGDWPPHLHFQVITDMLGNKGDYPGVCLKEEIDQYRKICPDPAVFFQDLSQ